MRAFIAGFSAILYQKVFAVKMMEDPDVQVPTILIAFFVLAVMQDIRELIGWQWGPSTQRRRG